MAAAGGERCRGCAGDRDHATVNGDCPMHPTHQFGAYTTSGFEVWIVDDFGSLVPVDEVPHGCLYLDPI